MNNSLNNRDITEIITYFQLKIDLILSTLNNVRKWESLFLVLACGTRLAVLAVKCLCVCVCHSGCQFLYIYTMHTFKSCLYQRNMNDVDSIKFGSISPEQRTAAVETAEGPLHEKSKLIYFPWDQ